MTPDQVLDRGADAIDADGWWQMREGEPYIGHCAITAMHNTRAAWLVYIDAVIALAHATAPEPRGGWEVAQVTSWNDAEGRTQHEVTSTMRAVAATLRAARNEGTRQQVGSSTDAKVATEDAEAINA